MIPTPVLAGDFGSLHFLKKAATPQRPASSHHHRKDHAVSSGFLLIAREPALLSPGTLRPPAPTSPLVSRGLCSSNVSFSSAPFISLPLRGCDAVPPILKNRKTTPSGHVFTQPLPCLSALPRKLLTHCPGSAACFLTASCPNVLLFHQTRFVFLTLRVLGFVQ